MISRQWITSGFALLGLAAIAGCQKQTETVGGPAPMQQQAGAAEISPGTRGTQQPPSPAKVSTVPSDEVMARVSDMLKESRARGNSPFPKGAHIMGASVGGNVVTLNFSKEFGQLENMGDSNESQAQKLLLKTMAQQPGVEKVRVTVEGKPFESQATDWSIPMSVHGENGENGANVTKTTETGDNRP